MEDKEDLYDEEKRLKTVQKKISKSKISKNNKIQISKFTNSCQASGVHDNKMSRYLYDLYNVAMWLKKDFKNTNTEDIEKIMVILEKAKNQNGQPYSEWTKRGYKILIRKFYKWLRKKKGKDFPKEVEWIKIKIKENKQKLPEDMLSENEVKSLINSGKYSRDKAIVAVLYDAGCRVGELLHLKIKDIEYFEHGMKIYLHGKTGTRRIPILYSVPYLTTWLNEHPTKKPEDSVWVKPDGKRLSYGRVRDLLKEIAKRAKINKKVNPHNFRHSRASAYSDRLTDRTMMEYFGWKKSDTISIYSHLNGKQIENSILEANGIIPDENKETELKPRICKRCNKANEVTALYCNCGYPLNEKIIEEMQIKAVERESADLFMDQLMKDPEVSELLKKKLKIKSISESISTSLPTVKSER